MKTCGISFSDLNSEKFCDYLYHITPKPNFWVVFLNKEKKEVNFEHFFVNYKQIANKLYDETKLIFCLSGDLIPPNDILTQLARIMKSKNSDIVFLEKNTDKGIIESSFSDIKLDCFLAKRDKIDSLFAQYQIDKNYDLVDLCIHKICMDDLKPS